MKSIFIAEILLEGPVLYSCSGGHNDNEHENVIVGNREISPTTIEDKPLPKPEILAENNAATKDVNATSRSKAIDKCIHVNTSRRIDAGLAAKGRELFQTSCTDYHTTTDQKLIGPGLKGITKIRTQEWIMNMVSGRIKWSHNGTIAENPVPRIQ